MNIKRTFSIQYVGSKRNEELMQLEECVTNEKNSLWCKIYEKYTLNFSTNN